MPKTVEGFFDNPTVEVLTYRDWRELGYPEFVCTALEVMNTTFAQDGDEQVTPEIFAARSVQDQMNTILVWEGIIGFSYSIVEAVRGLDKLKGTVS